LRGDRPDRAALNLGVGFDPAASEGIFTVGMAEYAELAPVGRLVQAFAREAANEPAQAWFRSLLQAAAAAD
jgi:hypothetical protein